MQTVFSLERERMWNDIDHTSWYESIGLFVDLALAKQCAQEEYEKETNGGAFDALQWFDETSDFPPERHWIETRLVFDKYKVAYGNFRIEEYPVYGY